MGSGWARKDIIGISWVFEVTSHLLEVLDVSAGAQVLGSIQCIKALWYRERLDDVHNERNTLERARDDKPYGTWFDIMFANAPAILQMVLK